MKQKYIILLALIIGVGTLNAQSLKRFKSEATEAFEAKDFSRALEYYHLIIEEAEDETAENYYNAAEAAREFRIYDEAEKYYRQVLLDTASRSTYQLANYHLGAVLKNQERYDEAIAYFQLFLDKNASFVSETYITKAQKEMEDCEWAKTLETDDFEITQLDTTVNTPNSEFSPILLGDELYFSSVRYKTDEDHLPRTPLTRIYISKESKLANQISDDFNEDLKHSANATFNQDASKVYYTICESVNATEVKCKIYYREKANDKWGQRVVLSNEINLENYTATQPNIGVDKTTGNEILFFVSDRPADANDVAKDLNIWYSIKEGDYFGAPVCVENLNTAEDDVTPFFDSQSQTLYFSSNGRKNIGGFDIYSVNKKDYGWEEVAHMGKPLNSSYDDLYYSLDAVEGSAFLSSNRKGATCDQEFERCGCNDIYKAPPMKVTIKVLTYNKLQYEETGDLASARLNGVTVVLDELESDVPGLTEVNDESNEYNYFGKFNLNYATKGDLEGYVSDDSLFNTFNVRGGSVIEIPLFLTPAVDLEVSVYNKVDNPKPIKGVKVELFEVEKESQDTLFENEVLVDTKKYNGVEDSEFGLDYRKDYRVKASKFGYSNDESDRNTTLNIPLTPAHLRDRLELCKKPPMTKLYFYNDEPGRRTRKTTTNISYKEAYNSLMSSSIRALFTEELASEMGEAAESEKFFGEVEEGLVMLDSFINLLLTDPAYIGNENVRVIVRGFASPRAKNDYNKKLTCRRIMSVENYFEAKGLLAAFPNQIIFIPDSNGEDKSDPLVADEKQGAKKSIFYANASRERRVEIEWILSVRDACPKESTEEDYKDNCNAPKQPPYKRSNY